MWVFVRDTIVKTHSADLRILAVMPPDRGAAIARQLAPLKAELLFVSRSAEAAVAIREDEVFQVALLPASLCDTDWWELWGVLALLIERPAILVYTRKATFQLWSGVLDSGGYDPWKCRRSPSRPRPLNGSVRWQFLCSLVRARRQD